jgi:hypothetical protein
MTVYQDTDKSKQDTDKSKQDTNNNLTMFNTLINLFCLKPNITLEEVNNLYNLYPASTYFKMVKLCFRKNIKAGVSKTIYHHYNVSKFINNLLEKNPDLNYDAAIKLCPFFLRKSDFRRVKRYKFQQEKSVAAKPKISTVEKKEKITSSKVEPKPENSGKDFDQTLNLVITGYDTIRDVLDFLGRNAGLTIANKRFLLERISANLESKKHDSAWLRNIKSLS